MTLCFLQDYQKTSLSRCTTNAPGAVEARFYQLAITVRVRNASSAPTVASSSPPTSSSSIHTESAHRTSTCNRTRRTSIPGVVTWNFPEIRRTRWCTRGRMWKQCSTAALESDYLIIQRQGSRQVLQSSRDHRLRRKFQPSCRRPRIHVSLHFRNYLCRCLEAWWWTMCGININRLPLLLPPRHPVFHFHPTLSRGSLREDQCSFLVSSWYLGDLLFGIDIAFDLLSSVHLITRFNDIFHCT